MIKERIIMSCVFGSHLYGTATESSDIDLKGIFLGEKRDILLQRVPKQYSIKRKKEEGEKNNANDVDIEIFSLYEFIKLSCEGQTLALDMLHAPKEMIYDTSDIWEKIVENRSKFYTKNLQAFVGYARRQAAKYSCRGSRLDAIDKFLKTLRKYEECDDRLESIWNEFELGEHVYMLGTDNNGIEQIQVCGKIFQSTSHIKYVIPIMQKFYDTYGQRAILAKENKGLDWKAISHAVRAALELKELLTDKTITFPLKEADLIKRIKLGKLDYVTEASPLLESLMDEIEELSKNSDLPEKVDRLYWDNFLLDVIEKYII